MEISAHALHLHLQSQQERTRIFSSDIQMDKVYGNPNYFGSKNAHDLTATVGTNSRRHCKWGNADYL
jgi:hypothetical protein